MSATTKELETIYKSALTNTVQAGIKELSKGNKQQHMKKEESMVTTPAKAKTTPEETEKKEAPPPKGQAENPTMSYKMDDETYKLLIKVAAHDDRTLKSVGIRSLKDYLKKYEKKHMK